MNSSKWVAATMRRHFPNTTIYPNIGNHGESSAKASTVMAIRAAAFSGLYETGMGTNREVNEKGTARLTGRVEEAPEDNE